MSTVHHAGGQPLRLQLMALVVVSAVLPSLLVTLVLLRAFTDPQWLQHALADVNQASLPAAGGAAPDPITALARWTVEQPGLRTAVAAGDRAAVDAQLHDLFGALPAAQSVLSAGLHLATASAAVFGLSLVVLAAGAGYWCARRLTQPLVVLRDTVAAFGEGERTVRAPIRGSREVREVALRFNAMADELAANQSDLERRVADRTRQLQAAKDAVEQERGVLTAIMASMSDGLLVLDGANRVRYCNARVSEFVGVPASELVGTTLHDAFARISPAFSDPAAVRAAWRQALSRLDQRPSFQACLDGPPRRDVLIQVFPVVDSTTAADGLGLVLRDVTAERDLARAKDELVSVVSHELRTPLASLVGFAELLLDRDYSPAQRQQYLTVMLQEGRRLTALINDFLDLQSMESGRQQIAAAPTDLPTLLTQAVEAAGDDPATPITLGVPEALPLVLADPGRIQQVLANLLSNARKYSPAGGAIEVTAHADTDNVTIAVRDHGLGIPAEALPCLFEKFYRVDNSDRRAIKGTGLGLAVVKQLVEAHGGRVWAESDGPGQGSRFVFTLPCAAESASHGDVLVVEDDPGFARLLEAELAAHGYSTVRVPSAEAALAQFAVAQPRVVLLDLMLPGMHGDAFLRRLRLVGEAAVPVIVVTVKDLDEPARAALMAQGAVAILRKGPGVAATAAQAVAEALQAPALVPA